MLEVFVLLGKHGLQQNGVMREAARKRNACRVTTKALTGCCDPHFCATMPNTVSLPFLGRPTVRVRRVPGVERLQVVLQDVFVHLGGVSSSNASKRIKSAREKIGRDVAIHQVREGPNVLLSTTLTDAVDLLIEIDVPAARELRHQLIQLGKLVLGGDPDGTVAAEIRANKQLLDSMPLEERSLFEELLEPEVGGFGVLVSRDELI